MRRLTGADIEAAIGAASPLVNPRLSEIDWDTVAVELERCDSHDPNSGPGSDWCENCGEFAEPVA